VYLKSLYTIQIF